MVRQRLVVTRVGAWLFVQRNQWIWKVRSDGSGIERVSPPTGGPRAVFDVGLEWSADGEWLLACDAETIYLISVTTGVVIPLGAASTESVPLRRAVGS